MNTRNCNLALSMVLGFLCAFSITAQPLNPTVHLLTINRLTTDTSRYSVDAVTVVASRSAIRNLNVPLAVNVITPDLFQNNRGFGLDEALSLVPGALVQSRSGNQDVRVMIRGFGARGAGERSNAGTTRGLRFLINGLPITEPDGRTSLDLVDISNATNIEVIRSNTSALWGNASGGVVSISTVPVGDVTFAEVSNTLGSFGYSKQSIRAVSSFANTSVYCSANNTNFDGWRDHSGSTIFQALAGVQSRLAPGTTLGITMMAASNVFHIPGPLTPAQYNANAQMAQSDTGVYNPTYVQRDERRFNRLGRIGVTLEHALASQHSVSCAVYAEPKYLQRSERNTFRDFNRYHIGGNAVYHYIADWSQSLSNHLQIGVDEQYQDGAILFYNLDPITHGRGTTLRDNKREGAENFGVFLQDQLTISEHLNVHVGGRMDKISYYSYSFITPKLNDERTFSQFSPKVGLSYLLQPTMSIYANFSQGVEVPAGNETDPPSALGEDTVRTLNSLLKPITSTTLELGFKHQHSFEEGLFKALSYDVSLYTISTKNDLIPYRGGRFYMPAATTTRSGIEIGAVADLSFGLRIMLSASVSKNTLTDYHFDSVYVNSSLAGHTLNLNNNEMPGVPGSFVTARLKYTPTFFNRLFVEAEWRMVSDYAVNDVNTVRADSYSIIDVSAGINQPLFGGVSLRAVARINNISDATYISSAWINPDLAIADKAPVYIEPGLPRNVSATLGIKYQW